MLVLGIETTCDETACSIVRDGHEILSNAIFSQADVHEIFGGVVPELACRRHVDVFIPVLEQSLKEANCQLKDIDLIAVAKGPGLIGALLVGINAAKTLSLALNKPLVGVNHIEAHLYAALMDDPSLEFPCLGVVLSGGHTSLIYMKSVGEYELLGQTVDDAIGEAFDKAAKIMGLPYPGGPQIEAIAKQGDPKKFQLKAGTVKSNPLDFSFSGLKTGVLYAYKTTSDKADLAAAFQQAAFNDIIKKTLLAADQKNCKTIVFGGGVTNNQTLRELFSQRAPKHKLLWPSLGLSLDNAAMIAGLGYHQFRLKGADSLTLEASTSINF